MFLRAFQNLLPRALAWDLTADKPLRQFFDGLSEAADAPREFFDDVFDDLDPAKTTQLNEWEAQFGLVDVALTTQERRDRLASTWQATGGQSLRYIEDTLQAAGFDAYLHEWYEPGTEAAVGVKAAATARNPLLVIRRNQRDIFYFAECGELDAACGEASALAGESLELAGYALVNKLTSTEKDITTLCGETFAACGQPQAVAGNYVRFTTFTRDYVVLLDVNSWSYFLYIGGATFGDIATIDAKRRNEFEALCLRLCPSHLWLGILADYS